MSLVATLITAQVAVASPLVVEGRGRPEVAVPRIEAAVQVDGVLDEPAWAQAVRLTGFSQLEPADGRPAAERTEVLVWYSPDAIHFGILAYDRDPGSIRATNADRDAIGDEDHVEVRGRGRDVRERARHETEAAVDLAGA